MEKKINVEINNDGKVLVETENYKGESCVTAIKELFSEFFDIDNFDYKSDYYEEEETNNNEVNTSL